MQLMQLGVRFMVAPDKAFSESKESFMQYCLPEMPSIYWVNKIRYRCSACTFAFDFYISDGNDGVIKFVENNGTEIRWLPVHGQGGYLDLFERFMPGFLASGKRMIPPVVSEFMQKLQIHIERSEAGNRFEISDARPQCPRCRKHDVEMLKETLLTSPEITWLKIDCELLQK